MNREVYIETKCGEFMKRLLFLLLVCSVLLFSACSLETNENEITASETVQTTISETETTTSSQEETTIAGNDPTKETRSDETKEETQVSSEEIPQESESTTAQVEIPPSTSTTEQSSSAETNSPPTTATTTEPETGDTEPKDSEDKEPTASAPTVPQASASDCKTIASKIVEYVNAYRSEEGVAAATVLPGLTTYAEYRSRQLISNFAHDTADERAAATALQYGEYVDPPLYGMTGDPYYTANAREAIAKAGYSGTADDVARKLANLVHSSSSHWNYVGGSEYGYIAVGVTYESGIWYCDIAVARTNTDNLT